MDTAESEETSPSPPPPHENTPGNTQTIPKPYTPPPQILKKRLWGSDDEADLAKENIPTIITDNTTYNRSGNDFVMATRAPASGFSRAFPAPPAQIYHGINKAPKTDSNNETEMREYNIKLNMELKRFLGREVNPGEKFKHTISILKKQIPIFSFYPFQNQTQIL